MKTTHGAKVHQRGRRDDVWALWAISNDQVLGCDVAMQRATGMQLVQAAKYISRNGQCIIDWYRTVL